jgi:hypothetical protein
VSAPLVPVLRGDALRALAYKAERAAREVGLFRRRVQADPELERFVYLADRLALDLEWVLLILAPSAGELVAWTYPGDTESVAAAIEAVDNWDEERRRLLGGLER